MNYFEISLEASFKGLILSKSEDKKIHDKLMKFYNNNIFKLNLVNDKDIINYLKEKGLISFFDINDIYKIYGIACYEGSEFKTKIKTLIDCTKDEKETLNSINSRIKLDNELLKYFKDKIDLENNNVIDFPKSKQKQPINFQNLRGYPQVL